MMIASMIQLTMNVATGPIAMYFGAKNSGGGRSGRHRRLGRARRADREVSAALAYAIALVTAPAAFCRAYRTQTSAARALLRVCDAGSVTAPCWRQVSPQRPQ